MAWFDTVPMTQVSHRIWVGGYVQAAKLVVENPAGITAVLNVSTEPPYPKNPQIIYQHVPFHDGEEIPRHQFAECLGWLKFVYENGHTILIHCLPGEMMANAPTPFRMDGVQGEEVCDLTGKIRKITNHIKRWYEGPMLEFKTAGNLPFRCTPEHPLLIIRPYRSGGGKVFKPNWKTKEAAKASAVHPIWVIASEVRNGDFLLCPTILPTVDIHPSFTCSTHHNAKPINIDIHPDVDLAWLFGLYIADGRHCGEYRFQLTLNDRTSRSRLESVLNRFGVGVAFDEHENYYKASVNSVSLTSTFRRWFGGDCYTKHIPEFLFGWDENCLRSLVLGYAEGDGHSRARYSKPTLRHSTVTTSQRLAYQLWQILVSLKFSPSLREYDKDGETNFGKRADSWQVSWVGNGEGKHHKTCYHDGYYCMPVMSTHTYDFAGYVYNFSVSDTETFLANGVVTHNCAAGISRSVTITAAFMDYVGLADFDTAMDRIRTARPIASPAPAVLVSAKKMLGCWPYDGSMVQMPEHEQTLHEVIESVIATRAANAHSDLACPMRQFLLTQEVDDNRPRHLIECSCGKLLTPLDIARSEDGNSQ